MAADNVDSNGMLPPPPPEMLDPARSERQLLPSSSPSSSFKNLLLIDSRVQQYGYIISSLNNDTGYIVFDYFIDTFETLKNKIAEQTSPEFESVGIVQDNYELPTYQLLHSAQPSILTNVEIEDGSLESWNETKDFCIFLQSTKQTKNYDLLACNTYSNPNWVYVINNLETHSGIEIRASSDITGWGGNWILESDNVDLTIVYFTEMIKEWQFTLGTSITSNITLTQASLSSYTWPISIDTSGVIVKFAENLTFTNVNQYFIIGNSNITIDGSGNTVTIQNVSYYFGLVKNDSGFNNNITVQNIGVLATGTTSLQGYCGWIGQQAFGNYATNCVIQNCYSTGTISGSGGGICGNIVGNLLGNLSITNCYSTGTISDGGGGICGPNAGRNNGIVSITNCYSTGTITGSSSGGICGSNAGNINGSVSITNCYSTGTNVNGGGGICANINGTQTRIDVSGCYVVGTATANTQVPKIFGSISGTYTISRTGWELNASPTWKNTNASQYLTNIGNNWTNTSNVWFEFLPNPGIPYLLRTMFTDMAAQYTSIYTASIFKTTGFLPYDLQTLYYAGNTLRLFSDAVISTVGYTDADYKTPYNIVAPNPQNQQVVISFTQDTSGVSITGYQYSLDSSASWQNASTNTSPITITGLTNGQTYSIYLRAVVSGAAYSYSTSTNSFTAMPQYMPNAPTGLSQVSSGVNWVSVNFTDGSNNGSTITNYQYLTDASSNWITVSTSKPIIMIGFLTADTSYNIQLRAVNAMGSGISSSILRVGTTSNYIPTVLNPIPGNNVDGTLWILGSTHSFSYTVPSNTFYDADVAYGDVLTYSLVNNNLSWLTFNPSTRVLTASGDMPSTSATYPITIRAMDTYNSYAEASFNVIVYNVITTSITTSRTITQGDVLRTPTGNWPVSINTSGVIVKFAENLTFAYVNQYFIIGNSNITIDGSGNTVSINNIANYAGLVSNSSRSKNNITVQKIGVLATGTTTLAANGGWIGQQYYSRNNLNNIITNCYSTGTISNNGGGICGQYSGDSGNLSITNCYSTGDIKGGSGGICGFQSGLGGNISISNCYSRGMIGDGTGSEGGGICGGYTINSSGSVSITNCYSTGNVWSNSNARGICGYNSGSVAISNCYFAGTAKTNTSADKIGGTGTISNTGWELNASPTWKNTNASIYLTNIGNNLATNSNVWLGFLPNPGVPYLLQTNFTDMAASYPSTYSASIFKTTGVSPNDLKLLYYAGNTLRLFSDATVSSLGYSDTDYKTPYNIVVAPNPQNQRVVISFTQDTSGVSITGYQYSLDISNNWQNASTNTSPITITGLTYGQTYSIYLRAIVSGGVGYTYSTSTNSFTAMPQYMPNAPTALSHVSSGANWVSVNFTDGSNNASTITNYQYTIDAGTNWITVSLSKPIMITGLTSDSTYNVQLRAVNAMGLGAASSVLSVGTINNTPINLSQTNSGANWVSISFTGIVDSVYPITNYQYLTDASTNWITRSPVSTSSPLYITGLPTVDTSYNVQLRAVNSMGSGVASSILKVGTVDNAPFNNGSNLITNQTFVYDTSQNGSYTINTNNFSDIDVSYGDVLTYSLQPETAASYTWLSLNPSTVVLSWTSIPKIATNYTIYIRATDRYSKYVDVSFILQARTQLISASCNITQNDVLNTYVWPVTIDTSGVIVKLATNITFTSVSQYFIIGNHNVSVDGSGNIVTIQNVVNYPGLLRNGVSSTQGKNNITIQNIGLSTTGTTTLLANNGWFGQQYFGYLSTNNVITNCYSTGTIVSGGGGICGQYAGKQGTLSITNCYSTGDISGNDAGGICGQYGAQTGNLTISNCYSTGLIRSKSGGICGSSAGYSSGTTTITNCYSTGNILDVSAGGICGSITGDLSGTVIASRCYVVGSTTVNTTNKIFGSIASNRISVTSPNTGFETNASPTWNNANAATYLTNIGNNLTNGTNIWLNFSPSPGVPYLLKSIFTNMAASKPSVYTSSLFKSSGYAGIDLRNLYYLGNTTRLFSDAALLAGGYSDVDYKAPYNLSVANNPQNQQAVITFNQDTSGVSITGYQYSLDSSTNWVNVSGSITSPITITGLTNARTYSIYLRAVVAGGVGYTYSSATGEIFATPLYMPYAPTKLSQITSTSSLVSVIFTDGSNNGYAITNYQYSIDNGTNWITRSPVNATSPISITGLPTTNTLYNLKLRAINFLGIGAASSTLIVGTTSINGVVGYLNNPTVLNPIPTLYVLSSIHSFSYTIPSNTFYDVDVSNGDVLSYSLIGTYPSWLTFNPSTRVLTASGDMPSTLATYPIVIRATDTINLYMDTSFNISVVNYNSPTVLNPIPSLYVLGSTRSFSYTIPSNTFYDADVAYGDVLTYSLVGTYPAWLTFNPSTRVLTASGDMPSTSAIYPIIIRATDITSLFADVSFNVFIYNLIPQTISSSRTISQYEVLNTPIGNWPVYINTGISVKFTENLTFTNVNQYFIIAASGITIDGSENTVSIENVANYNGLVSNTSASKNNIRVQKIGVLATGTTTLAANAGWIGGPNYGYSSIGNVITKCYSNGNISSYGGGICGYKAGEYYSQLTISYCYSIGNIGNYGGGICGYQAGLTSALLVINNCYSMGSISFTGAGGICGGELGSGSSDILIQRCYVVGTGNANNIYPKIIGPSTFGWSPTNSGWEPNASPTWNNGNASLYLTDQGSIWFKYLPDPGKRYDFLTSSNTGTSPYYNIIYNLTSAANPQNSQAVISFALNSGITITRYQYSFDGINNWQNTSTSTNTSPATITGLTNGQTYSIYLRAVLSGGVFPYTTASSPITVSPHYLSLAPINLSQVSSGSNWVSVNFTDVGFSDIPNTNYQYLTDASTNWITRSPASITSPIIISGLPTTDTSYNVQLRAVNSVGSGAASTILRVGTTSNNSPIILNPIPTLYVLSNIHSFSYTIPSNTFYDTDVLTYSLVNNNLSWLNIDSSTGVLTATVDMPSTITSYAIVIRATDTTNLFVDASFNVNVINNNSPTVLNPIPTLYVLSNIHSFSYTIPSNTVYDADVAYGDVLTYSLENNVLAWLSFNPSTRVLTASGDMPSTIATYPIIIRATDTSNQYVNVPFNVITYNVITSSITTSRSITQADILNTPLNNWPVSIDTSGVIVKFAENLTFTDSRQYFVIGTSNITIDGSGNTVSINNITNYAGLVSSQTASKNNITVKNIGVLASGTTTLAGNAGWIGQASYGFQSTNNVIMNCYSTGPIDGTRAGGICGYPAGYYGNLSITNCYSTGNIIGQFGGGICGLNAGWRGVLSIRNCYSTGNISSSGTGGICGTGAGYDTGIVSITNCYSTGTVGGGNGGICGALSGTQTRLDISNCYVVGTATANTTVNKIIGAVSGPYSISSATTGWEPNSSPTWKNANASLYLTGINTTTWFSYLLDPGKRYDFLTSSNTGTTPYYVLYDISAAANPQNQQAVISFSTNSLSSIGGTIAVIEYSLNGNSWATTNTNTSPAIIYGLTNGQTYTIYLRAVFSGISSYSYSIVSDPITVTPIYTPNAPTGISTAGSGTNWVSLNFTSGSNNGSAITNYQYSLDNGSNWITRSPANATSPITITGLPQDTLYNIRLRAVNAMGNSPQSDAFGISTINNTPTGLSLTQSGTSWVSISFIGASDSLYSTTNYQYSIDNSGTWYTRAPATTTSPITITGLTTQDTSYNIWLRAVNSIGPGTISNVLGVRTINNTPTGLSLVQSGNYWVSINFTGISDGLYSTVNYQYSINNGSTWLTRSPASSVSPIIIQNLPTIDTTYNVKLRAVDSAGSSGLASSTIQVGTADNSPTVLNPIPTLFVSYIIHSFSYTIPSNTFTDIDIPYSSETLTYSLIGTYPAWLTFVPSTRVLTGSTSMPSTFTDYIITIRATDTSTLYADASFVIQVRNPTISASCSISQSDINSQYMWPITIDTSGVVVSFAENLTFTNINQYFIIGAPNITIDGSGHTVSLNTPINYPGFIQNGNYNNSILGNSGTTIKNIGIIATGSTTLAPLGGWLAQTGFGYSSTNNIIQNCYSNGDIASYGGGICGQFSGQAGTLNIIYCYSTGAIASYGSGGICGQFSGQAGTLTITTCYSTGAIASDAGGICGSYIGRYNGTVVISNCYSNGVINGINAGGICGSYAGFSNGSVSISNCYSIGAINEISAGGICGYNTGYIGTVLISNCYVVGTTTVNNNNKIFGSIATNNIYVSSTNTGFETNGSSWNNVNASTYLTDLDVLWQGFVPDPGIPYLLKLYLGDVVGVYPATYPLSLFVSSGSQASYLRSIYRSDITTRLFTDASLIELGFTDVDFKTPYNISVDPNPQNHQAVIRFIQDTVGVSITGYQYSLDSSNNWINASTSTSPITITGLTNAQTYSIYLRADVSGAAYQYSTTANAFSATPKYMPTSPTSLSQYQSGSQWVSINLTDGSNNGFPITNYQYAIDNSTNWITASPANAVSPIIIKGFSTSDTSYNVWLRAVNSLGAGETSDVLRVGTINNKTTDLSQYQSGSKWVSINFTNVIDSVYPTTNYQYAIDNSTNWITRSPASTASPILIATGFATSDTSYNIWFRVVNSSPGTNNTSNVLRVGTINNKPTGLSQGQTGNYWMYINFTNVIDSVYPTTNYQYAIDNSANWITYSPATTSSPFFIPGFPTSDISYNLFFRTVNSSAGANDVSVLRVGTVDNPPIVANPIQNQTFVYDTIVNGSYTIPINTFYDIDVSYNVDNLTYSMVPLNSYPPWLTFSPSTRILTWTSIPKLSTNYTITIRATDVNSKFVDASFLLQARTQLISTSRDISQNDITQRYAWPVTITSPNTTVKFTNNFTFTSISHYFILTSNDITIDGSGNTITLNTPINYPGLVSCSSGSKNNNTIQNIGIISTGSTTLITNGGWIGQSLFGSASTYTIINNCYSIGDIGVGGGGICGSNAGQNGILSITNCYNIGNIGTNGGGICGLNSGQAGNLTISNCFSTGTIGSSAGGICGYACGFSTGIVSITNCYSTGTIVSSSSSGGGICGQYAGKQGTLTITNCYSTGDISGSDAGGICGQYSGDVSGNVSISNCYSTGVIATRSGGICGSSAGRSNGTTTITNCYSTGNILDVSAGGICGYIAGDLSGTVIASRCYVVGTATTDASTNKIFGSIASNKKSVTSPNTGFELNSSPTWKNTNAATYLTNVGNYLNNATDVWLEFLPGPGVPYLLKSLLGDMVYSYSATYPLSLFISTGLQVSYLRSLYYFNNTIRLFSDDSLYSTNNYTDANFKAPYNLTAPVDDEKAVIRFSQDTSGVSITGYQYSLDNIINWVDVSKNTSPITITGLTNKRAYSIYLRAVVSGASYAYSQESTSLNITPDAITTPPTRLSQNASGFKWVSIIFTAVTNTSHPTTNYQYSINNGTTWLTRSPVSAASPILIRDLPTADTSYNIQLRALSDIAPSTASSLKVIIVNNAPTVLNTIPNLLVSIDSPNFTYTIPSNTFTDIDLSYSTDVITYSLVQQPVLLSKLTYNSSTYLLTGSTIAALSVSTDFVITMRATDSGAKTSDASFILQTRKQRISTNTSISQSDILNNTYFWPVIIDTSGVVVTIAEDLTLSSATQYFVINADNVTLNGAGNTIRLYAINNYPGFVQNGTASIQCKNNTTLQNITVVSLLGTTTLAANGGWIGQSYFGRGLNTTSTSRNIVITNCNSIGILNNSGCGGICGQYAGRYGNLTITNCYSTSDISGADCGGICGQFTGDSSGNVSLTNCYSTGAMSGTNVGGICGPSAGNTSGRVSLTSCYSTGVMSGSGSGGICGSSAGNTSGTVSLSNCYSTGAMSGTSSGGICGSSAGIAGKLNVSSCYTTGYITGSGAGGICGDSTGSSTGKVDISYCYTSGIIGGGSAGGICGSNAGITGNLNISNCFTIGDISGGDSGGICGLRTKTATIRNCYTVGAIKGTNVGGICGSSAGYSTGTLTITNCYSTGDIIDASAGGICGYNTGDSSGTVLVSNCYVVGNTTGNTPTTSIPYNKIFGTIASNKTSVLYPNSGYELNTSLWNNANANTYLIGVSNESVWVHNFTRNKGYAIKTNLPDVERLRKYTAYDLYGAGYTNAQLLAFGYAQSDINNLPQGSMDIPQTFLFDSNTISATNNITYPSVKNSTTVSYQWYVRTLTSDISNNNAYMVVSGNDTTITYLLKGADYNKQIIVNASYTDSSNNVISVSSPFYNKWATFVFKVSSAEWAKNTNNIFPIINTNNSFKDVSYNSYTSNGTLTIPMYWSSFVDSGSSNNDGLHFYQNGAASYLTDSSFEIYNFYGAPLSRNTGQSFTNGIFSQFAGKITSSSIPTNMVPTILSNTSFSGVFYNCLSTQIGNIVNWNTSGVVNMSNAFYNASTFNQNIGSWTTQNVLNMSNMFCNANLFDQYIGGWNTAKCTNMSNMFYNANLFNQNIGAWNTAICTNMSNMFYNAIVFNQLIDSSGSTSWNTASCTDMSNMFYNAKKFNKRIANWNTTNVSNMSNMFNNAVEFNQLIDTSGTSWNTASCTNMSNMFTDAMSFNQSIVNWNTLGVINMSGMFKRAIAFNQLINTTANKWNTSNCTNMSEMFLGAIKFNQTITNWNTAKVATMENMFFAAASFNQHVIGNWTFTLVSNMKNMIQYSGYDYNTYSTFLQNLSNNASLPNNLILGNVSTSRIDDSSTTQLTSNAYTNLTKSVASGGKRMTIYDSSGTLVDLIANPPPVRTVSISTNSNNLGNIGFGTLTTSNISSSTINPNHKCLVITL